MNRIRLILVGVSVIAGIGATLWIQHTLKRLKDNKVLVLENKTLRAEKKLLTDSLQLSKTWLAKALIDTRNATELYHLTKGMAESFQGVIKVMRDSVIKINKDRTTLDTKLLECQKNLEQAKKKRR